MLMNRFHLSGRVPSLATLFALGLLLAEPFASVRADEISDPVGDILPTYTGTSLPGMDVVSHGVTLVGDRVFFYGRMAGPIAPTQEIGGLYLYGVDRGKGTPRFLGPAAPPVIGPNVLWDSIVRINPNGTGLFNNVIAGIITPIDPDDIVIDGNEFIASVPLSVMLPAATRPPCEWTYNLWPRNGIGHNVQVSDLAPDDGNSPFQSRPEVVCTTDVDSLWSPNHKMRSVRVFIEATDACTDPADLDLVEVIITSNEPDNLPGDEDGNTTGDTDGEDGFTAPVDVTQYFTFNPATGGFEGQVFLRAERAENSFGRNYTISATVMNSHNNWATSRAVVVVPSDQSL
jgi:hypothetical protein